MDEDACECDSLPLATNMGDYFRKKRLHEMHVKRREAAKAQTKMPCKHCGRLTNLHLIDTSQAFGTPERDQRFCFGCRPEAIEDSRFVIDRTEDYPLDERLKDLRGE
jgi:hypothetical protein